MQHDLNPLLVEDNGGCWNVARKQAGGSAKTVKAKMGENFTKKSSKYPILSVPHTFLNYNSRSPSIMLPLVTLLIPLGSYLPL